MSRDGLTPEKRGQESTPCLPTVGVQRVDLAAPARDTAGWKSQISFALSDVHFSSLGALASSTPHVQPRIDAGAHTRSVCLHLQPCSCRLLIDCLKYQELLRPQARGFLSSR